MPRLRLSTLRQRSGLAGGDVLIQTPAVAGEDGSLARSDEHWDSAYVRKGIGGTSWYEAEPTMSLSLIEALHVDQDAAVIDIGGGGSPLAASLLDRAFSDVSVLDVSAVALEESRRRAPDDGRVHYLHQDLLSWEPQRRYDLWHDRAFFHFLTSEEDRRAYVRALYASLGPGSAVILATFAADGPPTCSGLPVLRYSSEELTRILGNRFEPLEARRQAHVTPTGNAQPFTWLAGRIGDAVR
jgi:methyltransferase family protein